MELIFTIVRVLIGALFIGHGAQKLFGWFGGYGLAGTSQFMSSLGMNPGTLWAAIAGMGEFFGGLSLALGFFTPIGAAMIIAVMVMAILQVHGAKGLWNTEGGYEYNLVLIAVAVLYGLMEPTRYSVDAYMNYPVGQVSLFIGAVVVSVIGVFIAYATRQNEVQTS